MIDRDGAAVLAQVAATMFVALALSSLVTHTAANVIKKVDTWVEIVAIFATLWVTGGATATAAFGLETTALTGWLLGVPSVVAMMCIANLLHGVFVMRLQLASKDGDTADK